jgi:hypothetical protein
MQTAKISNKGQGTTEYIVILAIVVAIAYVLINTNLKSYLSSGISNIGSSITNAGK